MKSKIIAALEKARRVSITTDIWSSKCSTDSFIGITAHMVNPSTRKREVYRVCCRVFNSKHSGINIAKMMKRLFVEFHIEKKVFQILSDNASNMIKAVRDLQAMEEGDELDDFDDDGEDGEDSGVDEGSDCDSEPDNIDEDDEVEVVQKLSEDLEKEFEEHEIAFRAVNLERLPCTAHTMQLPINNCINKKKKSFGSVLRKTRKIVKKYRTSPKAKAILRRRVKHRLAGYVKTRWWTDVQMAKTVVKAARVSGNPLNDMMYQMDWNLELTEKDIATLESFISIMSPFQDLTDKLGGEKLSTLQLVYPSVKELMALLDEKIQKGEAKGFCKDVKSEVDKYFKFVTDAGHFNFNPIYIAATYLDPFYKLTLDEEMNKLAKEYLVKLIKEEQSGDVAEEDMVEIPLQETAVRQEEPKMVLPGFSRLSKDIMIKSKGDGSEQVKTIEALVGREFELYEKKAKAAFAKAVNKAEQRHKKKLEDQVQIDTEDVSDETKDGSEGSSKDKEAKVKPETGLLKFILCLGSKC